MVVSPRARSSSLAFIGIATLIALLLWSAVAGWLVPHLIRAAYRGSSLPLFNAIIHGRSVRSVDDYLARWNAMAAAGRVLVLIAGASAAVLTRPMVIGWLRRRRDWLVYALFVVIVGGHAFDIVTGSGVLAPEHWPFSAYPMYAGELGSTLEMLALYGVAETDPDHELALSDGQYLRPFDRSRLWGAFVRLSAGRDADRAELREALTDCLVRYERLRVRGAHEGPRLRELRLYRVWWTLEAAGPLEHRAPTRSLLFTVTAPTARAG
jgi:hypothetical protein